jgi:hypothetical protein
LVLLAGCGASAGASSGVTPGQITITTSKAQYQPGETISVTIGNGLASRVLVADHQSDCGVVTVEYQNGQTWQPQNPCLLKSPTRLVPIEAGTTHAQPVRPPQTSGSPAWPTGVYRVALSYHEDAAGSETMISSAQFHVA